MKRSAIAVNLLGVIGLVSILAFTSVEPKKQVAVDTAKVKSIKIELKAEDAQKFEQYLNNAKQAVVTSAMPSNVAQGVVAEIDKAVKILTDNVIPEKPAIKKP